jgi:predicted kinase
MKDSNTIILIVGLPGSGKSQLANRINNDNGGKFTIINDPKDLELVKGQIHKDLIITDPQLCFEKNRQQAEKLIKDLNPNCKLEWIYFKNDPDQCLINSNIRNRANSISFKPVKKVDSFIKNFSQYYTIPEGAFIVDVWS